MTNEIEILPAQRPAQADAIGQLMAHAQAMSSAKSLADALCDTDLVPAVYRGKPGNGAAAILFGAELGLNPIQSLQNIFVVHGQPSIYARTAVALLKRHGVKFQTIEESPQSVTIRATRGSEVEESNWTIERATTAGFTSNKKYSTEPQAMLWAKCAMEVSRRIAPDILLGIAYSSEELELEQPSAPRRVSSTRRGVEGLRAALAPAPEPIRVIEAEPEVEVETATGGMADSTRRKWINRMFALLTEADCTDRDDQLIVIAALAQRTEAMAHRDDLTDEQLRTVVNTLNEHAKSAALGQEVAEILNIAVLRAEDAVAG